LTKIEIHDQKPDRIQGRDCGSEVDNKAARYAIPPVSGTRLLSSIAMIAIGWKRERNNTSNQWTSRKR
jgi:hypothetical protein